MLGGNQDRTPKHLVQHNAQTGAPSQGGQADNITQAHNNAQPAQTAGFNTSMHILSSRLSRAIQAGRAPVVLAGHAKQLLSLRNAAAR